MSSGGGTYPFWARSGQELFYIGTGAQPQLMRVALQREQWALAPAGRRYSPSAARKYRPVAPSCSASPFGVPV